MHSVQMPAVRTHVGCVHQAWNTQSDEGEGKEENRDEEYPAQNQDHNSCYTTNNPVHSP